MNSEQLKSGMPEGEEELASEVSTDIEVWEGEGGRLGEDSEAKAVDTQFSRVVIKSEQIQ